MQETEMGRLREGFNSLGDSLYGVFAGIVDGEKKRNPSLRYDGGWWDTYGMFLKDEYSRQALHPLFLFSFWVSDACHPVWTGCQVTSTIHDTMRVFPLDVNSHLVSGIVQGSEVE